MKQLLVLSIFTACAFHAALAQKNCCNPLETPFIPGFPMVIASTTGSGEPDDVTCSCLSGEGGSTWFAFSATAGGDLELLIEPKAPGTDFNFSIWVDYCPCQQSQPPTSPNVVPIVCNNAAGTGPTGISTDPLTTFGVPNSAEFSPTVILETGKNYFLLVSNVANDGLGFNISMGATPHPAILGPRIPPPGSGPMQGPEQVCLGGSATFSVPPVFGATNYQWDVYPTGMPNMGAIPVNGPFPQMTLNFPTAGSFEVCVSAFGPNLGCFATAPVCKTVTVAAIPNPAGFASDIICAGDVYVAPNGQYFFYGGIFDVTYTTAQGCDSIVKLTLTQLQPDYNVLVREACEGSCIEFNNQTVCESGSFEQVLTNQDGCDSTTLLIFISVPIEAKITGADTIDCIQTSIVLSGATSIGGASMTYQWRRNNQNVGTGPTLTVTQGGSYTLITRSIVAGDTCTDQKTVFIVADNAPPQATAMGGVITCSEGSVTLQGSSTTPNVTYLWTGPGGFSSTQQNPTVSLTGTYTLKVTGKNGCTKTVTATVTGNTELPNATATGGAITCLDDEVTLTGQSSTPGVTYSWEGPGGFTSNLQNPVVGTVGNYILTVTAPNGCKKLTSATVTDNTAPPLAAASADDNLNCNTASVTLNGAGSSTGSQYSYLWSTTTGNIVAGGTSLTPTVDAPGTYTLLVTNTINGCTGTASADVVERPDVTAAISSQTNVNCFGEPTGSATATAGGGYGSFTYEWSNGQSGATATGLVAGTYSFTVTDEDGCSGTQQVTISQPALPLSVNASATPQMTFGVNDGTATASPSGGTSPYTYAWNNYETTASITGLAPGNYTVVVTDANGCTASQTVTVSESTCAVQVEVVYQDVSCPGAADGSATVNLNNATPPFTFLWSNGATTQTATQLGGGTYSVSATDANGCEVVATVSISEPSTLSANATATDLTGLASNDGTATANPTGGTAPYTYLWDNAETTATITGLAPGDYTVSVTDANGCEAVQAVSVLPFVCTMTASVISANATCHGSADGQATVTLANGTAPFIYEWSNGETTATITGLAPGTYSASVTDANNCPSVVETTITQPDALGFDLVEILEPECGASNGLVTVTGTGGTPGYNFEWSNGDTDNSIDGVAAGTYTISISDANGCEAAFDIEIGANDIVPPQAFTQDITVPLDANGEAAIVPADVNDNSTDDCGIASLTLDISTFNCGNLGENTVTLTVTDAGGNSSAATATATVVDITPPVADVTGTTVFLDANGEATLTPDMLANNSTDNCAIGGITLGQANFDCSDLGETSVEVTVADASGNTSTTSVTITVADNLPPSIDCPPTQILPACAPVAVFAPTATDNCAGAVQVAQTSGPPSGSTFPVGVTTVSFEATDAGGNASTCSFTVTVPTALSVTLTPDPVSCFGDDDGSVAAVTAGGSPGYTYLWSNGATTPTATNLVAGTYSVTASDQSGCTAAQTATVMQPPLLLTSLVSITNENAGQQNGAIDVEVAGGVPPYTYVWTDLMGNVLGNQQDISGLAAGTYQLRVTDANGCISLSGYTIQTVNSTNNTGLTGHVLLFPNPASGWVTLQLTGLPALPDVEVTALDVTGRVAFSYTAPGNEHLLDFTTNPSGVYFLKIVAGDDMLTLRLVVSR